MIFSWPVKQFDQGAVINQPASRSESGAQPVETGESAPATKGERTVQAILRATHKVIEEQGLSAASQDTIARRAGISQGALRYHFPTKQSLLSAFFVEMFRRHHAGMEQLLMQPCTDPVQRVLDIADVHLSHILQASDVVTFEEFAYLVRNEADRQIRDEWYAFLLEHYTALLQQIAPQANRDACESRGFQILTLCLGAWMTLGRSRPCLTDRQPHTLKEELLGMIREIVHRHEMETRSGVPD